MTHFEYLAVAYSIVISLAAVRLLNGLSVAFAKDRRYWPHALWIVFVFLSSTLVWWNLWSFREIDWNYLSFLLALGVTALLYLQAAALVPDDPALVQSWREHFFAVRARFFVSLGAYFMLVIVVTWLLLGMPLSDPSRLAQGTALGLAVLGAASNNARLHQILPAVFTGILLIAAMALFIRPDAIAP